MMKDFRKQWNEACLSAGIPSLSLSTCAKLMGILLHYGNNEAMVLTPKFTADCEYIQNRFNIHGGASPDPEFCKELQAVNAELEKCPDPPKWAVEMMRENYGIRIY